jgi:hypothetical protein
MRSKYRSIIGARKKNHFQCGWQCCGSENFVGIRIGSVFSVKSGSGIRIRIVYEKHIRVYLIFPQVSTNYLLIFELQMI